MKKAIYYFLLIFSIITFSFQKPITIEGKWFVLRFESLNGQTEKSNGKWIEFLNDGTLNGGTKEKEKIKTGLWKYDSIKKVLTIESEKKYGDEGSYIVKELTEEKMVLMKDSSKVFFVRKKH